MPLLEEEFDLVLANPGLGSAAMIGSEVGYELLVILGGLMRATVRPSREVPKTFPALCFVPFDPFDDCRARGSEDPGCKGGVLSVGEEELDHGCANGFRVLGISDTFIV
jgi:hypothetical protein